MTMILRIGGGVLFAIGATLSTVAAAQNTAPQRQVQPSKAKNYCDLINSDGDNRPPEIDETRSGTAMVGLLNCWDADPANPSYRALTDFYAHWTLQRIDGNIAIRDYDRESKTAILRLLVGHDRSFISSVRIDTHDPEQTITIPLVAFGYQGKVGKGESWTTDVVSDDQSQPYFRIGPSTSATITASAKSADDVEVRATGVILSTLRSLASIVTPGGSLLTTLNREPLNQASNAVDNALGNIWSKVKDERQISGRQLSEWYERSGFLIAVEVPNYVKTDEKVGDGVRTPNVSAKRLYWLRLSCPRYSIFDPALACERKPSEKAGPQPTQPERARGIKSSFFASSATAPEVAESGADAFRSRVTEQQILNFPLAQGKTLSQFLSDHAWYTQFLRMGDPGKSEDSKGNLATTLTKQSRTDIDYAGLCSQIVDALYGIGLSTFDAKLGLWATINGSSDFVGIRSNFNEVAQCADLLPEGSAGRWKFPPKPKIIP
jgi:hypothetical protein